MGSVRMERKAPGTKLVAKKAEVTLNTSSVSEGDEIPYNVVNYTEVDLGTIEFDKQAIGVTLEAIAKSGYDVAVQKADDDMLYKMENKIVTAFMNFIQTGTLTSTYATSDFQSAVAEAIGLPLTCTVISARRISPFRESSAWTTSKTSWDFQNSL